ncbi:MAG: hypothetical protein V9E98_11970 [Candidatus Nanopelagicales bacterium]
MSDPHEDLPSNVIALRGVSPGRATVRRCWSSTIGAVGLGADLRRLPA